MNPLHAGLFFVLLLLPNTTLRDWQSANAPHLHQIMASGSMALMNARTAEEDKITQEAGCRTLAAGARMSGGPPTENMDPKLDNDPNLVYPNRIHNLPSALRDYGVSITTVGDLAGWDMQPVPVDVGENLGIDLPTSHGGSPPTPDMRDIGKIPPNFYARTETGAYWKSVFGNGLVDRPIICHFIAVAFDGDPTKANEAIGKWADVVRQKGGELMVISPNPSKAEYDAQDQLTPIVLWGPEIPAGVLISPSTHTPGLVTNTDIAPTIADYFHAKLLIPPFGSALTTEGASNAPATLAHQDLIWRIQSVQQEAVPYIAGVIALLVAGATVFLLRSGRTGGGAAVFVSSLPFALLMSPAVLWFLSLMISAAGGAYGLRNSAKFAVVWGASIAAVGIVADAVLFAGSITAHSLIGYSPMEGARYYGLGNEAMGILVGALVVVTGALARFKKGWVWTVLIWLIAGFALGWPAAGAKAGGFFVALVALAAYAWVATGQSIRRPLPWIVTIAGICALGLLLALAGKFVGGHNHIGQAVELTRSQGMAAVRSLAWRKEAMDLHLVFHSVWALVLICGVGGAILLIRKQGMEESAMRVGVVTGLAATAACLALNDAGVVAAALCSLYLWAFCAVARSEDRVDAAAQEA